MPHVQLHRLKRWQDQLERAGQHLQEIVAKRSETDDVDPITEHAIDALLILSFLEKDVAEKAK